MSRFNAAVAAAFLLAAVPEARASVIVFDSWWPTSTNNTVVSGVTFTTSGPNFAVKTVSGFDGVGVAGGNEEIDANQGDWIQADFSVAGIVEHLTLAFLYNGPEFGDFAEIARVTVNGTTDFTLTTHPTLDNVAVWSGLGVVTNLSPADNTGGALWKIDNPFGTTAVTQLVFSAEFSGVCGTPPCDNQSDYSLSEMQFEAAPVPEPGTLVLLGAGLAGLGARRRRRT